MHSGRKKTSSSKKFQPMLLRRQLSVVGKLFTRRSTEYRKIANPSVLLLKCKEEERFSDSFQKSRKQAFELMKVYFFGKKNWNWKKRIGTSTTSSTAFCTLKEIWGPRASAISFLWQKNKQVRYNRFIKLFRPKEPWRQRTVGFFWQKQLKDFQRWITENYPSRSQRL